MPHLHLEHTGDIPESILSHDLLRRLHQIVHQRIGVPLANCKGRVLRLDSFLVGDGPCDQSFVHLRIRFLEGRSVEARRALGRDLLEHLKESLETSGRTPQITVSVEELARDFYFKHPPGTLSASDGA